MILGTGQRGRWRGHVFAINEFPHGARFAVDRVANDTQDLTALDVR